MNDFTVLSYLNPDDYPSRKVAVAMSGGVDSSLAAVLLKEAGFEVIGFTMKLWDYERSGGRSGDRGCCDISSFRDAKNVAASAGFPHYTVNLTDEFESVVINDFVTEYLSGRTPNPCVLCNTVIKWRTLRKKALALGCELIATGHYARIAGHGDGTFSLLTGIDKKKDQSYFLWGLDSESLAATLFPLGDMIKDETRAEAEKRSLKTANRSESQEICFIPDDDYGRFLRHHNQGEPPKSLDEGDILDTSGTVIGKHRGASYYTIGQRKGIGIALGRPMYVNAIDTAANTVTVGDKSDTVSKSMTVGAVNWIRGFPPGDEFECITRIRYRHVGIESSVRVTGENVTVTFESPQEAVTPGQSVVFYDGDFVLGGGVIDTMAG